MIKRVRLYFSILIIPRWFDGGEMRRWNKETVIEFYSVLSNSANKVLSFRLSIYLDNCRIRFECWSLNRFTDYDMALVVIAIHNCSIVIFMISIARLKKRKDIS